MINEILKKFSDKLKKDGWGAIEPWWFDNRCVFHNHHPGIGGAAEPLPTEVKKVADEINGQTLCISDVVSRIEEACPEGLVEVHVKNKFISLRVVGDLEKGYPVNAWRVICFVEDEEK